MGKGITGGRTAMDSSPAIGCPPVLFSYRCLSQRQHGFLLTRSGPCKAVATILIGIVPVPANPCPTYFVARNLGVQLPPKVLVMYDPPRGRFPTVALPALEALRYSPEQVLRVSDHFDLAYVV